LVGARFAGDQRARGRFIALGRLERFGRRRGPLRHGRGLHVEWIDNERVDAHVDERGDHQRYDDGALLDEDAFEECHGPRLPVGPGVYFISSTASSSPSLYRSSTGSTFANAP